MIRTNQGIEVMTRKNGHESSLPLPKILGVKYHQRYIVKVKKDGTIVGKPQKHHKNIFDNPNWNHKNFVQFMRKSHLPIDQGRPQGKEL